MSDNDEQLVTVKVKGGDRDGERFESPSDSLHDGRILGYVDGMYRFDRRDGGWRAVPVPTNVVQ